MKNNKMLSILCIFALIASFTLAFSSCKGRENGKIKIVTTVFPIYDFCRNVLGEQETGADLFMLLDNGVDLHSYQPSAKDMVAIAECDLFVYIGGESDEWAEDALRSAPSEKRIVLNLFEVLGEDLREEEEKEGMQKERDRGEDPGETEYDEHIWLSLKNAMAMTYAIAEAVKKIDAQNSAVYDENAVSYVSALQNLDEEYREAVENASVKTLVFADRFPFLYLLKDYGVDYYAAFSGCSAESEASFSTVTFLAGKIDELGLSFVLTIEGSQSKIAETVVANTVKKNQRILSLDSLQSTTAKEVAEGKTYLGAMEENLAVLQSALQ